MGFPLDRGSVEDGTLTCHWHHARFDLASGCTFDLWVDDVPTCPAEVRDGEVWVRPIFGYGDSAGHWRQRLDDGLAHVLGSWAPEIGSFSHDFFLSSLHCFARGVRGEASGICSGLMRRGVFYDNVVLSGASKRGVP
jgi:hypothetical protein